MHDTTESKDSVAGIDIGGTKIAVALADADGHLLGMTRFPTRVERGPHAVLREAVETVRRLATEAGTRVAAVGVGCAGPLDREAGLILSPPNLPGWDRFPIVDIVENRLDAPCVLDNDANAAALGEYRYGAGREVEDMVYITVSTGIGGGVIVGGEVLHGVGDAAGEIGHMIVWPDGPQCGCGALGCLEAVCSGTGIARRARERMGETAGDVTAADVVRLASEGDPAAAEVWDETIKYLALGIGNVIVTVAPETIVLGGGVSAAGDRLLEPLLARVRRDVTMIPPERVSVVLAELGVDSGVYGAMLLGRRALGL
jgi:glucokinase